MCIRLYCSFLARSCQSCNLYYKRLQAISSNSERHQVFNYKIQALLSIWRLFRDRCESSSGEDVNGNSLLLRNCGSAEMSYAYLLPFSLTFGRVSGNMVWASHSSIWLELFSLSKYRSLLLFYNVEQEYNLRQDYWLQVWNCRSTTRTTSRCSLLTLLWKLGIGHSPAARELCLLEDLPSKLRLAWVTLTSACLSKTVSCMGGYQRM